MEPVMAPPARYKFKCLDCGAVHSHRFYTDGLCTIPHKDGCPYPKGRRVLNAEVIEL